MEKSESLSIALSGRLTLSPDGDIPIVHKGEEFIYSSVMNKTSGRG